MLKSIKNLWTTPKQETVATNNYVDPATIHQKDFKERLEKRKNFEANFDEEGKPLDREIDEETKGEVDELLKIREDYKQWETKDKDIRDNDDYRELTFKAKMKEQKKILEKEPKKDMAYPLFERKRDIYYIIFGKFEDMPTMQSLFSVMPGVEGGKRRSRKTNRGNAMKRQKKRTRKQRNKKRVRS